MVDYDAERAVEAVAGPQRRREHLQAAGELVRELVADRLDLPPDDGTRDERRRQPEQADDRRREEQGEHEDRERAPERDADDCAWGNRHPRQLQVTLQLRPPTRRVLVAGRSPERYGRRPLGTQRARIVREGLDAG